MPKGVSANTEKTVDCMLEIDRFMFKMQERWDPGTLMQALCWSLGKWIGANAGDTAFLTFGDCVSQIAWSVSRRTVIADKTASKDGADLQSNTGVPND